MKTYVRVNQYIPGDPWRICDRCGRPIRVSESKRTWDNLFVCPNDWEPRHPQEVLNDAKTDKQSFPDPRPRPDNDESYETTQVATAGAAGDSTIVVDDISGMSDGDLCYIQLDSTNQHNTTINGTPSSATITLTDVLPSSAAVGNSVETFDQSDLILPSDL